MFRQIGNLAIVCAKRLDVEMFVANGECKIRFRNYGNCTENYIEETFSWDDDEKIEALIIELNFGKYAIPKSNYIS